MITYLVGQFWLLTHLSSWCSVWFLAELNGRLSWCHRVCGTVSWLAAADRYRRFLSSWGIFYICSGNCSWRRFPFDLLFFNIQKIPWPQIQGEGSFFLLWFQKEYICRKGAVVQRKRPLPPLERISGQCCGRPKTFPACFPLSETQGFGIRHTRTTQAATVFTHTLAQAEDMDLNFRIHI